MRIAICLLVLFAVANASVLKKAGTKKSDPCNLSRVGRIVAKGLQRSWCEELRKDGGLKKKRYLRDYFADQATKNFYLPRRAVKNRLVRSLPKKAMWARKRLMKLRVECARQFKRSLSTDQHPKVVRKEFVKYFMPRLKRKKCLTIKGFKFGPRKNRGGKPSGGKPSGGKPSGGKPSGGKPSGGKPSGGKPSGGKPSGGKPSGGKPSGGKPSGGPPSTTHCKSGNAPSGSAPSSSAPSGGSSPSRKRKGCNSTELKRVARVITRGFQRLYCARLDARPGLRKKRFLRNYFRRYQTRRGYLPRRALRKRLRQRLPARSQKLRKRLVGLRARCVRKFKRSLSTDGDVRVTRKDFVQYFKPRINRQFCKRFNKGGKKCNLKRVARVITRGFQQLYCVRLGARPGLRKKRFLRNYFRRYQTRRGYLPRRALRKRLRQRLPGKSQKLRKRLVGLRAKCVREFKRSLSKDGDVRVTRRDFVQYFKPRLSRNDCNWVDGNTDYKKGKH